MLKHLFALAVVSSLSSGAFAQQVVDPDLTVQTYTRGLRNPVGAEIINSRNDMFVIEKNTGKVVQVRDRRVRRTVLDLPVANDSERGLLGITLSPTYAQDNFVYLYYTASDRDGGTPIANAVVRYQYDGEKLVFNRKVKTMPADVGPNHNGGRLAFGPDGKLYVGTGDLNRNETTSNFNSRTVNRAGVIMRLEPYGGSPTDNPFYSTRNIGTANEALNDIYAYGIRNSYGMTFDPVSGKLWQTENGRTEYDEVNLVEPGFNSGWERIMGPTSRQGTPDLISLGANAAYSDPEFSWKACVAPTDMLFMPNGRLGKEYRGDLFVGTTRGGKILRFDMNTARDGFVLPPNLQDLVADSTDADRFLESEAITFGQEFGTIGDLFAGPGGVYVVSFSNGAIYRITTADAGMTAQSLSLVRTADAVLPEPAMGSLIIGLGLLLGRRRGRVLHKSGKNG
jgi:aldose sugar dehydrogenase